MIVPCYNERDGIVDTIASLLDHNPVPSERKSGIPDGVEIPAPVRTTVRFACRKRRFAVSIFLIAELAKLLIPLLS